VTELDSSTATDLHWATTVINPALSIVGLLPTPALRTAALLATLRTEVTRRSGKEHPGASATPRPAVAGRPGPAVSDTRLPLPIIAARNNAGSHH
jgi:hypothetical protein